MKPENVEPKDSPAACTTTHISESLRAWCELANESPLPIWIAHSDGAPVHFNSAWQCFTNADSGSGLSAPTIHPDDVSAVESACRQFAFTQLPFHLEFRLRHSVGRYRWQSSTGMPVLTERGVVAGLVVTSSTSKIGLRWSERRCVASSRCANSDGWPRSEVGSWT